MVSRSKFVVWLVALCAIVALVRPVAASAATESVAPPPAQIAAMGSADPSAPSATAKPAATSKPAASKPQQKRKAKPAKVVAPTKAASVYLMRGFLGVFSLGMDRLDASLRAKGVKTRILSHTGWPSVVSEILAEQALHPGQHAPVVIVGHSLGGNAALQAGYVLGKQGFPVDLVVTVDPTMSRPISPVVKRYLNVYMSGDAFGTKLAATGKAVANDDIRSNPLLNKPGVNHFTMDENPLVQQQILNEVMRTLGRSGRRG